MRPLSKSKEKERRCGEGEASPGPIDGSGGAPISTLPATSANPSGLAIDTATHRLYWSNFTDNTHAIVTIATSAQAAPLLTEGAVFWVVKPRFFAGNLSGLDTLLSGSYVGILPAASRGKKQTTFKGQENPPLLEADVPGRKFLLKSKRIGSISVGSPIFFRDLAVGEVLGWDITDMAESVMIHAFIRAPYDSYVSEQTRFWNASGISLGLGPQGVDIKMESLRALLLGGIAGPK